MLKLRSKSKSLSFLSGPEIDFLNICKNNVSSIVSALASGGELLINRRQCLDLSSKLSRTVQNVSELVLYCEPSSSTGPYMFRPALEDLYRHLEKAKLLVSNCWQKDWCLAAVFQCQNENSFREIVLEVALCYNAIFELAKSASSDWNDPPEDLRLSEDPVFVPATDSDVQADQQELKQRLDDLANGYGGVKRLDYFKSSRAAQRQSLAKYLLMKMYCNSLESHAHTLDEFSAILWTKVSEPLGTWGSSRFLGAGSGASGVCSTIWLGVPCAKKEFHGSASESLFLKEAGILAHLKHPRIVNFICCGNGVERGDRFIAMELMDMSLFDFIEEQKGVSFPLGVAIDIILQIARGVCYLHSQGVAHRDLKPHNVVVSRETTPYLSEIYVCVKLVDFGMSKTKVEVSKVNTISHRGVGTFMYRAPEVHPMANRSSQGKVNWFKADAFSFAMTCVHLLSLEIPFKDMSSSELFKELTISARRPQLPDICPRDLITLLEDCWKTNPERRPSFQEIWTRLETLKYKILRGVSTLGQGVKESEVDSDAGFDFITKMKMGEMSSSIQSLLDDDDAQGDFNNVKVVSILPCSCGRTLDLTPQIPMEPPYLGSFVCDICMATITNGEVYRCDTCQFDLHSSCANLTNEVVAPFHDHPLGLLVRDPYKNDPNVLCHFCKESLQKSKWVYRCEECDVDVHALCTKYITEIMWYYYHPHPLKLVQCQSNESCFCTCCNVEVRGNARYYTCKLEACEFALHPRCAIRSWNPLCIFDDSHRLDLITEQRRFYCGRCGAHGFSWLCHCDHCEVDIHIDCVDEMEEGDDWNIAYKRFMEEQGTMDNHAKVDMLTELLDKLQMSDASEASSSTSSPPPVLEGAMVEPTIHRLAASEEPGLGAFDSVELRRKLIAETAERKVKRMAAKGARQKLKAKSPEILDNLEKIVLDLQSSDDMSEADGLVLAASQEKLTIWRNK